MKKAVTVLLILALFVNLVLAIIIESQKNVADDKSAAIGTCFAGDGGCNKVQTSTYAKVFLISNPLLGIIVFGLLILLLPFVSHPNRSKYLAPGIAITMVSAALFSAWLLYIQFFVLYTTCVYCLWVDGIMIVSAIVFLIVFRKEVFRRLR